MCELHNYRFRMHMQGGYKNDIWGLTGNVYNSDSYRDGYQIMVSSPVSFDEVNNIITTQSGRQYKLVNCDGDIDEVHQEIRNVISRGGYSRH